MGRAALPGTVVVSVVFGPFAVGVALVAATPESRALSLNERETGNIRRCSSSGMISLNVAFGQMILSGLGAGP